MDLKPGIYRLTQDVVNPHVDRRQKYDWRAREVLEKGAEFKVSQYTPGREFAEITEISLVGEYSSHTVFARQASPGLYEALVPHLVLVKETLGSVLAFHDITGVSVNKMPLCRLLADLLDMNKITIEDVKAAIQRNKDRWDKDDDQGTASGAFQEKYGI